MSIRFNKFLKYFAKLVSLRIYIIYRLFLRYINRAIYLVLVIDVDINFCLRNIYAIDSSLIINMYLRINF